MEKANNKFNGNDNRDEYPENKNIDDYEDDYDEDDYYDDDYYDDDEGGVINIEELLDAEMRNVKIPQFSELCNDDDSDDIEKASDRNAVRMLVRIRTDFQTMRKQIDNRLGLKADGNPQKNMQKKMLRVGDFEDFWLISRFAKLQEKKTEQKLLSALERFPVYTEFLKTIKGIGPVTAGYIIGEIDINIATTVSKIWQYAGLNPGYILGKKPKKDAAGNIVKDKNDRPVYEQTETWIKGDKLTPGFMSPYNKRLKTALMGVMADVFIKQQQATYALKYYYPYKNRLQHSEKFTSVVKKGGGVVETRWKETTKRHRDLAAKRYMVKMFLKDLYATWREIEGLPVREPYQEEYLGHRHSA